MKRQAAVLILVFVLLVSLLGCSKAIKPKETVSIGYECRFDLKIEGIKYTGSAKFSGDKAEFELASPEEIKGLHLILEGDKYSIKYADITYNGGRNELLSGNPIVNICDILFETRGNQTFERDKNGYYCEGETDKGDYKIYYRADGFPQKIIFTEADTEIEFSSISYLF